MLRTGKQYLESLAARGGEIYIGGERVENVAAHPAYRNAAGTVARMYDTTSAPSNLEALTYLEAETGKRCNSMAFSLTANSHNKGASDGGFFSA